MSKDSKAPKPSIEMSDGADEEQERQQGQRARGPKVTFQDAWESAADAVRNRAAAEDVQTAVGFVAGLGAAAWKYAVSHPYTVFYGFVGLVLAVLILTIGLWDTIVIAVFVCVGAMIGQIRDGDNGIVNFFSRLFSGRH